MNKLCIQHFENNFRFFNLDVIKICYNVKYEYSKINQILILKYFIKFKTKTLISKCTSTIFLTFNY